MYQSLPEISLVWTAEMVLDTLLCTSNLCCRSNKIPCFRFIKTIWANILMLFLSVYCIQLFNMCTCWNQVALANDVGKNVEELLSYLAITVKVDFSGSLLCVQQVRPTVCWVSTYVLCCWSGVTTILLHGYFLCDYYLGAVSVHGVKNALICWQTPLCMMNWT